MPQHTPAQIVALLAEQGVTIAPHELGLMAYAPDPLRYYRALQRCNPVTLRILTMDQHDPAPVQPPACREDAYTCQCPQHADDRVTAMAPRRKVKQPWEPKPARRAA